MNRRSAAIFLRKCRGGLFNFFSTMLLGSKDRVYGLLSEGILFRDDNFLGSYLSISIDTHLNLLPIICLLLHHRVRTH